MIHQFFDYETVKEGFESVETPDAADATDETATDETATDNSDNTKLLKDVGFLVVFYILFVFIFMISGTIIFKYIIMTRLGESIIGCIPGFPVNLSYRKNNSEFYDNFFSDDKEILLDKEYPCDYFTYTRKDEKNETKVFLPINFSYNPYYNDWLYRYDFNTGIPGTNYSLDADRNKSFGIGEVDPNILSNTFPINWFWPTFTSIFIGMNNIFTNGVAPSVAVIFILLLALSSTISMVTTTIDQNIYPSAYSILSSILNPISMLIYFPIFILSFTSLFWSINLVNFYEDDKRMHLMFLNYVFFQNFWFNLGAKIMAICAVFACLVAWLWINIFLIFSQFLPLFMTAMFFICIFSRAYGSYTYNNQTKKLDFYNILTEIFPIYCCTNMWIIFFMLFAFVLLASAINPTIGAITFVCMFFGILIFYTSIKNMIKNILSKLSPRLATPSAPPLENELKEQNSNKLPPVDFSEPSAPPLEMGADKDSNAPGNQSVFYDSPPDLQRLEQSKKIYEERQAAKEQAAKEAANAPADFPEGPTPSAPPLEMDTDQAAKDQAAKYQERTS